MAVPTLLGGSGRIFESYVSGIQKAGGLIVTNAAVEEIVMRKGRLLASVWQTIK